MNSCYLIRLGGVACAIADVVNYYDLGWYITRLNVSPGERGKGHGRALLKQITDAADQEKVTLLLEIEPSGGLTYDELQAWYERAGFRKWNGIFRRLPCITS